MTTIETAERVLVQVGVFEVDHASLLDIDPSNVAEQTVLALEAYDQGNANAFNAAFEKTVLDPELSEFSKKAHILFRQHMHLERLTLAHEWTPQRLIGNTSLYGYAKFTHTGSIQTAFYKGYNWGENVPAHLRAHEVSLTD